MHSLPMLLTVFVASAFCARVLAAPSVDSSLPGPQYALAPECPAMDDSVSFRIVYVSDSACVPERYEQSASIIQTSSNVCVRSPCPQDFTVRLRYFPYVPHCGNQGTPPRDRTRYGPVFNLGRLEVGTYTVVDSMDSDRVLMTFSVYETRPAFAVSGTIYEATPPGVIGCGYSPVGCVVGTVAGCTVSVIIPVSQSGPASASSPLLPEKYRAVTDSIGKFSIDSVPAATVVVLANKAGFAPESKSVTLQTDVSTPAYFALQRLTTNTKGTRPVALEKMVQESTRRVISWSRTSKTLSLAIPDAQSVTVTAFMINGSRVSQLVRKRFLPAGITKIRFDNAAAGRGVIIFKVQGEHFSETATVNLQ